jgi:hypothetical protein
VEDIQGACGLVEEAAQATESLLAEEVGGFSEERRREARSIAGAIVRVGPDGRAELHSFGVDSPMQGGPNRTYAGRPGADSVSEAQAEELRARWLRDVSAQTTTPGELLQRLAGLAHQSHELAPRLVSDDLQAGLLLVNADGARSVQVNFCNLELLARETAEVDRVLVDLFRQARPGAWDPAPVALRLREGGFGRQPAVSSFAHRSTR